MPLNVSLLLILLTATRVQSLLCNSVIFFRPTARTRLLSREDRPDNDESMSNNRRSFIANIVLGPLLSPSLLINIDNAEAACLSGDIREECIGVYKMPMDDEALSYVDTPEKLKRFAPDLNWVSGLEFTALWRKNCRLP